MMGKVYLVGAGPGDPDLITVRGLRVLQRADVVVYDRLVNPALLDEAPTWAERVFAGKAPSYKALTQDEINALLVERARAGNVVVRLKGGDPFVFGRGGEEALACAEAGIPWEVVPGISSAVGVPTGAGVPVTHRGIAGSFAVVTGHRAGDDDVDWAPLAHIDTLVVLMGVSRLAHTVGMLLQHRRDPQTPVVIIERGTWPDERITSGTLETIVELAERQDVRPPATIVIGAVAGLRARMQIETSPVREAATAFTQDRRSRVQKEQPPLQNGRKDGVEQFIIGLSGLPTAL